MTLSLPARFVAWLDAIPVADEVERRNARTVQIFCLGLGTLLLASAVAELTGKGAGGSGPRLTFGAFADLSSAAACVWSLRAARTGRLAASYRVLVVAFIGVLTVSLAVRGLAYHERLYVRAYAVLLVIPAFLLGRRALWWSFACVMAGLLVGYAHDTLWAQPLPAPEPLLGTWRQAIAISLLFCVLVDRFGTALREAYAAAVARRIELERAVEQLEEEAKRRSRAEGMLLESQKLEVLGRLSGSVAHDFNNILAAIQGFTDLASASLSRDHVAEQSLAEIRSAANRGGNLTGQLLAFARRQTIEPRPVVVEERLRSLSPMLTRLAGNATRLVLRLEAVPWSVLMDPTRLEQVILNLVANARDAMPEGGTLTIETRNAADEAGEWVELSVSDDGIGMDASTLERVFEPFFTTKEAGKGTGLGLATSHGVVSQAGGTIRVESKRGHGTTVRVRLPRLLAARTEG